MTVELRPMGVACNIQCQYCYQNPQRDAGNVERTYDLEAMKAAIEREGGPFSLFGGDPLLLPKHDLEELLAWGLERFGSNGIQTNGALLDDDHVQLFRRYGVAVGVSIDGPGELNDARWAGTLERTRAATAATEAALAALCAADVHTSVIVTLHRLNAAADHLPRLHTWFRELDALGIHSARLHALEVEDRSVADAYQLTPAETLDAFRSFHAAAGTYQRLTLDVFTDMRRLLLADDENTTCIWNACDPYTTAAVRGVEGHGQSSNCGRTNKEGIDFVKTDRPGFHRYLALYHTPQAHGGCQGCRFFAMCKGECPGTAIDGDWRNRTADCELWMALFEDLEAELVAAGEEPLSLHPDREAVEGELLRQWAAGTTITLARARRVVHGEAVGPAPAPHEHGDAPHGDVPHGDSWRDER